ncbi:MAG TPA: DUF4388 domain-containing protein [Polyangia bacterium]|jgi:ActR/RegA family two-component response regulator
MTKPSSLLIVDADLHGLETLTYGFEREGCKVTRTSDLSRAVQLSRTSGPALATVMLREPSPPALEVLAALRSAHRDMPILALGDAALETSARAAGATDFLRTPTYIRDVVNAAKVSAYGDDDEALLSEYHGLFYLLRAMAATARSCVLRLARGSQRAEIRFKNGKVTSANVRALQNLPALHHMLLWEEARVTVANGPVSKPNQFPLSAQEVLDESERFMRDFAHAARDLGPPSTIYRPVDEPRPAITGMQPNQMVPLLRLFDGKHGLADVVEESPFRIFDTIRMIRRLVEGGVLTTQTTQTTRRPSGPHQRISRPAAPANGTRSSTGPQSMLGQWAMVPDQRGVVGDRRSASRPLMPFGTHAGDQPGMGSDRRRQSQPLPALGRSPSRPMPTLGRSPSQPMPTLARRPSQPLPTLSTPGPTPLPTPLPVQAEAPPPVQTEAPPPVQIEAPPPVQTEAPPPVQSEAPPPAQTEAPPPMQAEAPIPLTHKKVPSGDVATIKGELEIVSGEIPPVKPRQTPDAQAIALEPTVQVKVDADGMPLELPPVRPARNTPAPAPVARQKTPAPMPITTPAPRLKTPIPARVTPAAAFDAVEADFFAREADLYKREAVETFDDLDPMGGGDTPRSKSRRRRK